jgi:hypothetical protein
MDVVWFELALDILGVTPARYHHRGPRPSGRPHAGAVRHGQWRRDSPNRANSTISDLNRRVIWGVVSPHTARLHQRPLMTLSNFRPSVVPCAGADHGRQRVSKAA